MGLLLVGHGSSRTAAPDALLQRHAAALRADGRFAEVRAATLADPAGLRAALAGIACRDVFVVPMLMCEGLLCTEVLPDALAADGVAGGDGHRVHLCPPIGVHPGVATVVLRRVGADLAAAGLRAADATLLLIGHGSTRHPAAARAVRLQAARLARARAFARIATAFICQEPRLADALPALPRPLAGFALFTARGNHVVSDVEGVFAKHAAADVLLCGTLGEDDGVCDIIRAMLPQPRTVFRRHA